MFNCIINTLETEGNKNPSEEDFSNVDYLKSLAHLSKNLGLFEPTLVVLSLADKELEALKSQNMHDDARES